MRTLQAAAKAEPKKAAAKPAPKPAEKATKVAKAKATTKIVKKSIAKKQTKVRKNVHFFRPKTLKQARKPMSQPGCHFHSCVFEGGNENADICIFN